MINQNNKGAISIKTYNDLLEVGEAEEKRIEFILSAINEHKASEKYKTAQAADLYFKHQNPTINEYQKYIYDQFGSKVPDIWSPNNKIFSNWYNYFTVQAVSYLLGNGVSFENGAKEKLGKNFDEKMFNLAVNAKNGGVSFGYWNLDHLEVFSLLEFVPLYDENDGGLKAGIRFWQIDNTKPMRAILYELDGYTQYLKPKDDEMRVFEPKKPYRQTFHVADIGEEIILDGENYQNFPIIPLYNANKQSDLVGNRGTIDAYDLTISGLINNVSGGEFLYWVLTNCDGMNDEEVSQFVQRLVTTHFAKADGTDEGSRIEAHKAEVPIQATSEALERLTEQLYRDFMALKVENIASGAVTATQIKAAYEPINQKTDLFEMQVTAFINNLLELIGIDDMPTYTRSQMSNQEEIITTVLQCGEYLDDEYITEKILTVLGDGDKVEEVMKRKTEEQANRYALESEADTETDAGAVDDVATETEAIDTEEETTGKTLNGTKMQLLLTVIRSLADGKITEGQAVNIVSAAIGVTKEEAIAIIRGE